MGVLGRGWWPSRGPRLRGRRRHSNASAALERRRPRHLGIRVSRSSVVVALRPSRRRRARRRRDPRLVEAAAGSSDPFVPSSAFDPFVGSPSPSANPRTGVPAAARPASATSASRRSLSRRRAELRSYAPSCSGGAPWRWRGRARGPRPRARRRPGGRLCRRTRRGGRDGPARLVGKMMTRPAQGPRPPAPEGSRMRIRAASDPPPRDRSPGFEPAANRSARRALRRSCSRSRLRCSRSRRLSAFARSRVSRSRASRSRARARRSSRRVPGSPPRRGASRRGAGRSRRFAPPRGGAWTRAPGAPRRARGAPPPTARARRPRPRGRGASRRWRCTSARDRPRSGGGAPGGRGSRARRGSGSSGASPRAGCPRAREPDRAGGTPRRPPRRREGACPRSRSRGDDRRGRASARACRRGRRAGASSSRDANEEDGSTPAEDRMCAYIPNDDRRRRSEARARRPTAGVARRDRGARGRGVFECHKRRGGRPRARVYFKRACRQLRRASFSLLRSHAVKSSSALEMISLVTRRITASRHARLRPFPRPRRGAARARTPRASPRVLARRPARGVPQPHPVSRPGARAPATNDPTRRAPFSRASLLRSPLSPLAHPRASSSDPAPRRRRLALLPHRSTLRLSQEVTVSSDGGVSVTLPPTDPRAAHARDVLRVKPGDSLRVGSS